MSKKKEIDRFKKQEAYDSIMRQKASFKRQKEYSNLQMLLIAIGVMAALIIASIIYNKSF